MSLNLSWTPSAIVLSELYQGGCFSLAPDKSSQRLGDMVRELWSELFDCTAADVHAHYHNTEILRRLKALRQRLYQSDRIRKQQCAVAIEAGLTGDRIWIDALRIRVLTPHMLRLTEALPVYYAHRDTWYANPLEQVNIWMPLGDVCAEESFEIYPHYFQSPIKNSSHEFDYSYFSSHIGWQSSDSGQAQAYPSALEKLHGPCLSIEGPTDSIWCFSGQHLHQSCRGQKHTRVSIDFRCIPQYHKASCPPKNVDNASLGSTRDDFFCMEISNLLA